MKNSIAIWADNPPNDSDLHINYWIIKKKKFFRDHFLDFGVKLSDWEGGKVHFYIPIKNIDECISEIGSELKKRELSNALFNENCEITTSSDKRFEIKLPNEKLTIFTFDKNHDLTSEQLYDGTLFSIKFPDERQNWYIRFRVKIQYYLALRNFIKLRKEKRKWKTIRSSFSEKHTPGGSFYQSVRSSIEAVDFRVNDKRSLNLSLLDEKQGLFLNLRKLHFLLIHDIDEELIFSTTKVKKTRLLEDEIWSAYLHGISGSEKKYCANQWTCSPQRSDGWEIFLKLRYASANVMTIGWYIILIVFISYFVNILSALSYDKLKKTDFFNKILENKCETNSLPTEKLFP